MSKPELGAVKAYGGEIGLSTFECEKFYDYFEANGWRVGRNPMKDWKAALRNWKRNARAWMSGRQPAPPEKRAGW